MNQMLQDQTSQTTDPPVRSHPRFAKPQRIAFVQSSWHREVVMECQTAFLVEAAFCSEVEDIDTVQRAIRPVPHKMLDRCSGIGIGRLPQRREEGIGVVHG